MPLYVLTTLYLPFFPFLKYTLYPLAPLTFLIFTFILLPDLFAFITGFPGFVIHFAILEDEPFTTLRVKEIVPLGSHDLFLAEVVNVQADDRYLNPETGKFELDRANPLVYTHGEYFGLGKKIGKFGWSVEKKKKKNKK